MKAQLGVQLYTLREACEKDFLGTLKEVANLGYKGVEFAGFYNVESDVLKAKLDDLGLTAVASHTPMEALADDLDSVITYNKVIGNSNIVCPWSEWTSEEEFYNNVKLLNKVVKKLAEAGMNLYYHNHAHEFEKIGSDYALDVLFKETKEAGMMVELDTYWVHVAGVNPVAYMEQYKDRCGIIHLKDMKIKEGEKVPAAIGNGQIPIKDILQKAEDLSIPWVLVENDYPEPNGIDNITMSMLYLRGLNL